MVGCNFSLKGGVIRGIDRIHPLHKKRGTVPFRLIEVGEIGGAVPGFVRAGRPRSRVVVMRLPLKAGVIMGYKPGTSFTRWSGNGVVPG